MRHLITGILALLVMEMSAACSSQMTKNDYEKEMRTDNNQYYTKVRSKWSDKNMRVMVDPNSSGAANAIEVQTLLIKQDKWTVIDRGIGFHSAINEQNLVHLNMNERFEASQKWSHWGKMKGVGSVVVPYFDCEVSSSRAYLWCDATLTMIDASTGEILVAVRAEKKMTQGRGVLDWEDMVEELAERYPRKFEPDQRYRNVIDYEEESVKNAQKKKFQ